MRIVVLTENTSRREDLQAEHGLSLYIETGARKLLFDAGQSGAFADNAQTLGVDLRQVDTAVLSHGHYDHGGGLERFSRINPAAPIWLNPRAFEEHYNASDKFIGLDPALAQRASLRFAREEEALGDGMTLYQTIPCKMPIRPFGLTMGKEKAPEDFRHEQYLLVEEKGKKICFSGCSHRGIRNIMDHFRPDVLIGGFHFMKLAPDSQELEAAAAALLRYPAQYYTGHCTGLEQYEALKLRMGDRLHPLYTGQEILL